MLKKIIPFLVLILLLACAKNKVEMSVTDRMEKADELYSKKKYARAAELYDEISFEKRSAVSAQALMKLADCYFKLNKFTDARLKYIQMTGSFPDYPDIETAYYRIGLCYYEESLPPQLDQTETMQCITAFRAFIDKFPNSKYYNDALEYIHKCQYKLLQKTYYNGYIYYKMSDYSAALMYFEEIIGLGNTDDLDRKSLYYSVKIHLAQKNHTAAKTAYESLVSKYPDSKETKKLHKYFK